MPIKRNLMPLATNCQLDVVAQGIEIVLSGCRAAAVR
jgi:hypothetical protein